MKASIPIFAAMFVTRFDFYCSVCLSEGFFPAFQHCKIAKEKKQAFLKLNNCKKILNCLRRATALYNLRIVAILLTNTRKLLKFYRFESAQNLVSFIDMNLFFVFLVYIAAKAGIVFNLFLNF